MGWRPREIISGGQSGADLAGIAAAKELGIPYTVNVFPGFKPLYLSRMELETFASDRCVHDVVFDERYIDALKARTEYNVEFANATLIIICNELWQTRGSALTKKLCDRLERPCLVVREADDNAVGFVKLFLDANKPAILNIAGERYCDEALVSSILVQAMAW